MGNDLVIVGGDWNVILNPKLDARNYRSFVNRPRSRKRLNEILDLFELIDVWREIFPEKRCYTWRKFNSVKQSRLDYFLISEELMSEVNEAKISPGYRSDHSIGCIGLKTGTAKNQRSGRQYWKFNNSLLKDKKYIDMIKHVISEIKKQYALPVYNLDNIDSIPNNQIGFKINDQLFFETLLMEVRGMTISYSTYKKKEETREEQILLNDINNLESVNNLDHNSVLILQEKNNRLEEIRKKRLEGMMIRSRVQWIQEGEKTSRYFCNLEHRNYTCKCIFFLEKSNGELIFEEKEILKETTNFYENLYRQREVMNVDLGSIIQSAPKLNTEEQKTLEGPITLSEAHTALRQMKNNKSPGSDGYTGEFMKFFFADIGDFLIRSLNYGFQNGQMSVTQKQGIITCIPKEGKPKHLLKNWRPISLLNTTYKIASACIANRLKCVLPKLILPHQKGFMKGRYIGENLRLLYDTILYTKANNMPGLILLIDFEKAFDSISWSFIDKVLNFFNFGPDVMKWINAFYTDINSCVHVNGCYSSWFNIQRGVRQGDPLSPYLYLICAEVLSHMLLENKCIKGIKIRDKENILSQFADDTALYLDGSEQSFVTAVRTLNRFANLSGLNINYEKTQVVWIGSRKGSHVRYLRDMNFCWDPGIFRYLGVLFSTSIDEIVMLNYEGKLKEIRKLLNMWKKRQLTPYGKIIVLKTLALSKLTYLFVNLPDPPKTFMKELDCMFFSFLWNGKSSKINKKCVCNVYQQGGLRMIDVSCFLSAMKISWLRRMYFADSISEHVSIFYPDLMKLNMFGSQYANKIIHDISNPFWHDVLKHYMKLSNKCIPMNIDEFNAECIFYNVNIKRGNRTIHLRNWLQEGIHKIQHLIDETGNYLTFGDFQRSYPNIVTNFLTYGGIIQAVQTFQNKIKIIPTKRYPLQDSKTWMVIGKGNKYVQFMLLWTDTLPAGICKWNRYFSNLNWKQIFEKIYKTTIDCQLRWFQSRILHRILPTGRYLFLRKIVDSPLCSFCHTEEETIQHMLWKCRYVAIFWNDLQELLITKCTTCINLKFSEPLILFGVENNVHSDTVLDLIILLAKMFIYKCKWKPSTPNIYNFINFLRHRFVTEKYRSLTENNIHTFEENWQPYKNVIHEYSIWT